VAIEDRLRAHALHCALLDALHQAYERLLAHHLVGAFAEQAKRHCASGCATGSGAAQASHAGEAEERLAARLLLSGGWTDLPPPTLEGAGGLLINGAITIDGAMPICARARRIAEPVLRLSSERGTIDLSTVHELYSFRDPHSMHSVGRRAILSVELVRVLHAS
jgi:hypothetical protein